VVKLALQDAYHLLAALGDPAGECFQAEGLDAMESPLNVRNHSILAHGFVPVTQATYDRLWKAALELSGVTQSELPPFSLLGAR